MTGDVNHLAQMLVEGVMGDVASRNALQDVLRDLGFDEAVPILQRLLTLPEWLQDQKEEMESEMDHLQGEGEIEELSLFRQMDVKVARGKWLALDFVQDYLEADQ